jgi:subtilisin-like proprotein convertase family protein
MPAKDQRGVMRPQPDNGRCDIGAYEVVGFENNATVLVPANGCATSAIAINANYAIGKLNVGVNATFNPRGAFRVTLVSPAGKRVALLGPTGGTAVDLDAMFDDAAPGGVPGSGTNDTNSPFYDNLYRPYESLATLNNVSIKGTWTLEACSLTSATGFVNSWLMLVPKISTTSSHRLSAPVHAKMPGREDLPGPALRRRRCASCVSSGSEREIFGVHTGRLNSCLVTLSTIIERDARATP